jgi:enoyl-CoA hydratase/carnithine racemase
MSGTHTNQEPDSILVESKPSGITTITINRAHRKNAVDTSTAKKLAESLLAFEVDSTQKVAILHGAHGTFCAGFDLHELAKKDGAGDDAGAGPKMAQPVDGQNLGPMGPSRMQIKKPLISAVSGYAVAGGLELALLGDMRVVEEDAVFGVFCRRWGVPLIDGGTIRLGAIIGLGRALDMILTGRPVDAQEALAFGLANRVVPTGKSLEVAEGIARQLVAFPQACMRADRASAYYAAYNAKSFEDALSYEFENGSKVIDSESVKGAIRFSGGAGRHGKFEEGAKL